MVEAASALVTGVQGISTDFHGSWDSINLSASEGNRVITFAMNWFLNLLKLMAHILPIWLRQRHILLHHHPQKKERTDKMEVKTTLSLQQPRR